MCNFFHRTVMVIRMISVEPAMLLQGAAVQMYIIALFRGVYLTVCEKHFLPFNPEIHCANLSSWPQIEDSVQKQSTRWLMVLSFAVVVPACPAVLLWGAYADKHGRKHTIILGMTGFIFHMIGFVPVLAWPYLPLYTLIIISVLTGFTGVLTNSYVSIQSYMSDLCTDRSTLTLRFGILQCFGIIGCIIGSFGGSLLARRFDLVVLLLSCIALELLGLIYVVFVLVQTPPISRHLKLNISQMNESDQIIQGEIAPDEVSATDDNDDDMVITTEFEDARSVSIFIQAWTLLKASIYAFIRKREGYTRCYIWILFVLYFAYATIGLGLEGSVSSLFLQRRPLEFVAYQLQQVQFVNSVVTLIGAFVGLMVLKKLFNIRDTLLIIIACMSCILRTCLFGSADTVWFVYVALTCSIFENLLSPTVLSFVSQSVSEDEVGKLFTVFGISVDFAIAFCNVVYSSIYTLTESFLPGFVFYCASGFLSIPLLVVFWVHFRLMREVVVCDD